MKRKWHHPEEDPNAKTLVRSLGELQDADGYRKQHELEFPKAAEEMRDEQDQDLSRRGFVKLMGASTALAGLGLAACRRPVGHIVPYAESTEWVVPGKPLLYTTAMPRLGGCTPMIATTHEGRPTHLQGNPLHPGNPGGGVDSFANSSILDLYDPERSGDYKHSGATISKEEFDQALAGIRAKGTDGLAILHGESTSPTRARVLAELGAKTYSYEPLNFDNLNAATEAAFGEGARQIFDFSKAKRILSIGCDFLGLDRLGESGIAQFAAGRKVDGDGSATEKMNRLYVLEHAYTLTGGMADHRLPLAASQLHGATAQIAKALGVSVGADGGEVIDPDWVKAMAADLQKGDALIVAGPRLPAQIHALVLEMNQAAIGKSIKVVSSGAKKASGTISDLAKAIGSGAVKTLVITTSADPVYDAPADLKFGELLKQVENVIHVSPRNLCATARAADWQVPSTHYLEEWGDVRASDGTYSIVQPMIMPLYDGVSELNFLLSLSAAEKEAEEGVEPTDAALEAVKATFAEIAKAAGAEDVDQAWNHALRDGFLPGSAHKPAAAAGNGSVQIASSKPAAAPNPDAFEVVFTADSKVWDGRYINNGWQQECPDPISKVVWDNAALVSVATLQKLGLSDKDMFIEDKTHLIKVTVNDVDKFYPVIAAPGHADNSISISMGYGQKDAGKVAGGNDGSGTGFDCFPQRTSATSYIATGAKVELVKEKVVARDDLPKSKTYTIALTQEHNSMEGRALYRDANAEQFDHDKDFVHKRGMEAHAPANKQIYKGQEFDYERDHQWGMTVDLNACIGCSACTIACQSENNIPIVGKDQVIIGREMHWIRMDRYFAPHTEVHTDDSGHAHREMKSEEMAAQMANPEMLMQPVACQQCESAPCETVCPVNATVHTPEGLNAMAYNRCIGTRYCMNNCPYKARRFNFFDYNKRPLDQLYKGPISDKDQTGMRESHKLQKNPNVTVRMRGVVEKCTYCVQRLQEAKFRQKAVARSDGDNLRIPTDSVKSACQSACPANAIEFGDLANKDSAVVKAKESPRSYDLLGYLGVRPRTSFLARIKNPNMDMPDAKSIGQSTMPTAAH